jgi:ribosomal protein S15P/S13E
MKYEELQYIPDEPVLKDTNPKDAIGSTKLPLDLVPDTMPAYAALAFLEGATKYGSMNWRVAGVRASIYMAAAKRHMAKYWNGEWADEKTKVPHLASAMACMAIILDADAAGKLTDDRPPKVDLTSLIDGMEATVKHLKELHKDHNPKHNYATDVESVPQ